MDIGFVGLGHIGGAIAANLVADGHAVSVRDVDGAKQATLVEAGAHGSESIAGVAERSEVTFLSLPTPAIMEQVTLEWLDAAAPGAVLVDLTTNAPATVRELGGRVVASGREFLECPLTGGAPGARMRMLVFICGGEPSTYERRRAAPRRARAGPLSPRAARLRQRRQAREQPDGVHGDLGLVGRARDRRASRHRPARPRRHDADGRRHELLHRADGRGHQRTRAPARVRARPRGQGRRPAARRRARRRRPRAGRRRHRAGDGPGEVDGPRRARLHRPRRGHGARRRRAAGVAAAG